MALKQRQNVGYGLSQGLVSIFPFPIKALRDPSTSDRAEPGTVWTNTSNNNVFILSSVANNVSNWLNIAGGGGDFDSLTVDPGPVDINGTMTVDGATFSLDSTTASNVTVTGAAQDLTVASVGGSVVIDGSEAVANAVNITASGVGGGVTIDGDAFSIDSTTASNVTVTGAGQDLTLSSVGGSVPITSTEASNTAIHLDASDGVGGILVEAGNLIQLTTNTVDGNISLLSNKVITAGAAATVNSYMGTSVHTGLTTAAGATETITITNNKVLLATDGVMVTASNIGANDAKMTVERVIPAAGTITIHLQNNGAAALNGDLIITFMIIT